MLKSCILLLTIILFLQGCSTSSVNKTFLNVTAQQLQKDYKLNHGTLIIQYNLAALSKNDCIYAKNFGLVINNDKYNKAFLQKFKAIGSKNINSQAINNQAMIKSTKIKDLLIKLNCKYKFLSPEQLQLVQKASNKNSSYNLKELAQLDKLTTAIPIMLPQYNVKVTSHYGMRKHPRKKQKKFHCGIDLKGYQDFSIYASANGTIITVKRKSSYGNLIEIKHSDKFITKYAHLKKMHVKEGDIVTKGQVIGVQGNSGNSTGEHLHFEIWLNNKPVNPFDFISHACNC
ncbi:M23 family metallopeptidase [Rickettsia endosymbiont of Culicoides newsteadi]|uniref:M23 family metallopeptidase n=1 Tax=Rickettsia endosymbiont of Culicoides newsteadi TaxID=1961830 RepID=UPI000B9C44BB|nr:M23 family metallopeptidase [Rickettsia endosymbiont of Culicoides newsteadi]OZG31664.1 membrane protein [Rickettsia endosymbiont of Culicoides newsteadi]